MTSLSAGVPSWQSRSLRTNVSAPADRAPAGIRLTQRGVESYLNEGPAGAVGIGKEPSASIAWPSI